MNNLMLSTGINCIKFSLSYNLGVIGHISVMQVIINKQHRRVDMPLILEYLLINQKFLCHPPYHMRSLCDQE